MYILNALTVTPIAWLRRWSQKVPHTMDGLCAPSCNRFIKFISNPHTERKRKNKRIRKDIEYCEICLRSSDELPSGLHEHHIWGFSNNPALDLDADNRMVLCRTCHTIVHNIRSLCGTSKREYSGLNVGVEYKPIPIEGF